MAPLLRPQDFWSEEQLDALKDGPVLTQPQLHQLRQQIDALRRINVQLRLLKYRARTGQEPPPLGFNLLHAGSGRGSSRAGSRGGGGRGRGGGKAQGEGLMIAGGRGKGRGRGRRGKRGREDESEDDDSIVVGSSEEGEEEEEAELGSSEEGEEKGAGEFDSADTSESEEDYTLPMVLSPRRTGRMRRPTSAAAVRDGEAGGSSSGGEEEDEGTAAAGVLAQGVQEGAEDAAQEQGEVAAGKAGAAAAAERLPAKPAGGHKAKGSGTEGGGGMGRRGLFRVVSEDTLAEGAPLRLPQLKPVNASLFAKKRRSGEEGEEEGEEEGGQQQQKKDEEGGEGGDEGQEEEEEVVCSACGDSEAPDDANLLLLCEGKGCSVAVHQQCYGVHTVPEGEWLCDACKAKLKPAGANCCVCPVVGGAVRKVCELGRLVPAGGGKPQKSKKGGKGSCGAGMPYCHVACALWVPEIVFADPETFSGVRLGKLTAVRVKLKCELCKQAGGGAVQCAFGTCCRAFHVLCGRAAGYHHQFRLTDGEPLAFCGLHSQPTFAKIVDEMVEGVRLPEPGAAVLEELMAE